MHLLPPLLAIAGCASAESEDAAAEYEAEYEIEDAAVDAATAHEVVDSSGETKGGEIYDEYERRKSRVGWETYEEYDARRDSYRGTFGVFHGDGCTLDCSGHEAGYEWARDRGVTSADECGGTHWSFEEGCKAYAEENGG